VLAKSDLPVETHPQPVLLNESSPSSSQARSTPYQPTAPDDAFTSFNITDKGLSLNKDLMDIKWSHSDSEQPASPSYETNKRGGKVKGKQKA
jgi:hypothetical protein